jgi:hypothetical protein
MKKLFILILVIGLTWTNAALAETDFLEAAAPAGWHFQYFNIYQHSNSFARDDVPIDKFNLDVNVNLLRPTRWFDNGVVHAIIPFGYIDQTVDAPGQFNLISDSKWSFGDAYIGGAYRWYSEKANDKADPAAKWWLLAGNDFRLPTGKYSGKADPSSSKFIPNSDVNFGSGSFSIQPFMILSTLFAEGMLGTDTEVRYCINTSTGSINYNPHNKLEIWQTLHMGVAPGLRAGIASKGEFAMTSDDTGSSYVGVGPELMWMKDNFVIWAKVLFGVHAKDTAEDMTTAYVRMSWKF